MASFVGVKGKCPECGKTSYERCLECGCCDDCCACPPQDDSAADAYRDEVSDGM